MRPSSVSVKRPRASGGLRDVAAELLQQLALVSGHAHVGVRAVPWRMQAWGTARSTPGTLPRIVLSRDDAKGSLHYVTYVPERRGGVRHLEVCAEKPDHHLRATGADATLP